MGEPTVHTLEVPGACLHVEVRGSGPALLMIAGGGTDAGIFDGIAPALADVYTVITYDPRGNSRSPLTGPLVDQQIEVHADDAHRLLAHLADERASVFGSSSGAQVALDLLARHPDAVRKVVAHEPPSIELLPDAATYRALFDDVEAIHRREGGGPAMRAFLDGVGLDRPTPVDHVTAPPQVTAMQARISANNDFFLEHEMASFARFVPDVAALGPVAGRLILAVGRDTGDRFPSQPATALARQLGTDTVVFPGGHVGYATHAAAFVTQLAGVLA